ncbi:MAG: GAF domain-containing protein [Solirubrobacterales bacterium]
MKAYRAPMRARDRDESQFAGARFGVGRGLVGIGDHLPEPPANLDDAVAAAGIEHGEKAGRMLSRFADLPKGTFVWTQTGDREFRLGRIIGDWAYDDSASAREVGIHHVRPTDWLDEKFDLARTPLAVIDTFARGGRNFQRINSDRIEVETLGIHRLHV